MALTWHPLDTMAQEGYVKFRVGTVDLDNSYTAGGYVVPASTLGLEDSIYMAHFGAAGGYVLQWNAANGSIQIFLQDYDLASADGPLVEAPANATLSGVTGVPYTVFGR